MAQLSRSALQTNIDTDLADNNLEEISAADTRGTQTDLNDSCFNTTTDDSDDITEGATNLWLTTAERAQIAATTNAVVLKGDWDASAGTFPGGGSAQTGWTYIVTVAGTVDSVSFALNDRILATTDNASTSTYASNWLKLDYTDQVLSVAGKTGTVTLDGDDVSDSATRVMVTTGTQTFTGPKTFDEAALGNEPIIAITGNETLDENHANRLSKLDITGSVTLTVADISIANISVGARFDFCWLTDSGSNSVTFADSEAQSIISKDGNLAMSAVGSGATLIYIATNTWWLCGDLA